MAKKTTSKSRKQTSKKPQKGAGRQNKPRARIKVGREAEKARAKQAERPLTFWGVFVRLLPVWVLIVLILLLEPTLPLRAATGVVSWVRDLLPEREAASPPPAEPVFIVEGAQGAPLESPDVPTPDWETAIASTFDPAVQHWAPSIGTWSQEYRLRPNLIATLMQIESCGNPEARSQDGKLGLFQVPADVFARRDDPFDPATNAELGLQRFTDLYARTNGDLGLTFAAYIGGEDMLGLSPAQWPDPVQSYQFWASGIYEEAEMGLRESPTLIDWYRSGGAGLCAQAADVLGLEGER